MQKSEGLPEKVTKQHTHKLKKLVKPKGTEGPQIVEYYSTPELKPDAGDATYWWEKDAGAEEGSVL